MIMEQRKIKGIFSGSTLKIIAVVTMLIDHIASRILYAEEYAVLYKIMRYTGRISFPIFCFLLVEGFFHTRNVKKYMLRLAIFSVISEIPFDMSRTGRFVLEFNHQNVFFTLLIGLVVIFFMDKFKSNGIIQCVICAAGCLLAYFMKTDYRYYGILQIAAFYYFSQMWLIKDLCVSWVNICMGQPTAIAALGFTELYNGKRGLNLKYLFYVFYPLHLIVLYFIRVYLNV